MSQDTIAIALVGMCGAGKSTAAEPLRELGWPVVYFGKATMEELKRRGLEINEQNERRIREELRVEHGMGAFAELKWPEVSAALESGNVVIDGLYSWSEYRILRDRIGDRMSVVAVVAARDLRYQRLAERPERSLTREEAIARDTSEIENLEKGGPIAMADYTLINNGSAEKLRDAMTALLKKLQG